MVLTVLRNRLVLRADPGLEIGPNFHSHRSRRSRALWQKLMKLQDEAHFNLRTFSMGTLGRSLTFGAYRTAAFDAIF